MSFADALASLSRHTRADHDPPPGAAASFRLDAADDHDPGWYPQGLTTTTGPDNQQVVITAAYRRGPRGLHLASRITLIDIDGGRYDHVALATPHRLPLPARAALLPVPIHAGGLACDGRTLWVADTFGGLREFDLDGLRRATGWERRIGPYVLPQRRRLCSGPRTMPRLRFSYCSIEETRTPRRLHVGEYRRRDARIAPRLVSFPLDGPHGIRDSTTRVYADAPPTAARPHQQGVAVVDGATYASSSRGASRAGTLAQRPHEHAPWHEFEDWLSIGCEDLAYEPVTRRLWCQGEYPGKRAVYAIAWPHTPTEEAPR